MDLALLCPFPVGLVAWCSPEPRRTVLVKATFALDRDGALELAPEQRPLDLDRLSRAFPDELEAASDFAPHKERVDVLLVGHAHAAVPASVMALAFTIGEISRSFVAVAAEPAARIPLSAHRLRTDASPSGLPVRVGPLAPQSAPRRARAGDHALDRDGAPIGSLRDDFDFAFFNAAPLPQQLDALRSGTELTLSGLLPRAPERTVSIPRRRPLVYLMDATTERGGATVGLRCDTVVIDTDRAELSLVWRGSFDASAAREHSYLLVAFEPAGTRWSPRELQQRLEHAQRSKAIEEADLRSLAAPRSEAHPAAFDSPSAPPPSRGALSIGRPRTLVLTPGAGRDGVSALPFRAAVDTKLESAVSPSLPFGFVSPPAFVSTPASVAPRPADDEVTVTSLLIRAESAGRPPLPFDVPPPPIAPAPIAPAPIAIEPARAREVVVTPTAREAEREILEPSPPDRELLTVAKYAAIRTELSRGRRREVLARHGFDVSSWRHEERMQIAALEQAALDGQTDRAAALMEALDRAELE